MTWNFDTMKEALSEMEKVDYQEFIKAFLSLELSISNRTIPQSGLSRLYG